MKEDNDDISDKDLNLLAEKFSDGYQQPHILIRFLMLYREVDKLNKVLEFLKGNLESSPDYFPFGFWLCEQILEEIKRTPKNQKYFTKIEEILKIIENITFKDISIEGEKQILNTQIFLKEKINNLFNQEKNNFSTIEFTKLKDKENIQELLDIYYLIINSQKEILPL